MYVPFVEKVRAVSVAESHVAGNGKQRAIHVSPQRRGAAKAQTTLRLRASEALAMMP
jgi:hypothetical protein